MSAYVVDGSFPIKGKIRAGGNKNSALPCIAATLLTDEPVVLKRLPDIEDVHVMLQILTTLGASIERLGPNQVRIHASDISTHEIPAKQAKNIRASILFAGPLLARTGSVTLPPPGGDVIGRRRLDTHFLAFEGLGARVHTDGAFFLRANNLVVENLFLDEASVTATENAIMASVLAAGTTVIENAASEPHVQDLCHMLNAMGAHIEGIGSNILRVAGVTALHGTEFELGADFMEVGSFIGLAAVTRGELTIERAGPQHLKMTRIAFNRLGIRWEADGDTIHVPARQQLQVEPD